MLLAGVINAKVHLFSGLVVGALIAAAVGKMKRSCRCSGDNCDYIQPSSGNNEEKPPA